jgi:RNA polymerase sigma-70 factor, ECF subfamily
MADTGTTAQAAIRSTERAANPALDSVLVRQVIGGSQDALARLYDRHSVAVFNAARRKSGDPSVAAEVVQDTFLALWNRAESFDPAKGSLLAWLLTIARNRAVDRQRFASRHERATTFSSFEAADVEDQSVVEWLTSSGELIGSASPERAPETVLVESETRAMIDAALTALSPAERRAIALAYDVGLTQTQIAATEQWPLGTVKTRTRRALRILREQLEAQAATSPASPALMPRPDPSPCVAPC